MILALRNYAGQIEPMGRIELPYTVYDTVALPLSYMGTAVSLSYTSLLLVSGRTGGR